MKKLGFKFWFFVAALLMIFGYILISSAMYLAAIAIFIAAFLGFIWFLMKIWR